MHVRRMEWTRESDQIVFFDPASTSSDALKSIVKPIYGETTAKRN
jgi:hypothetical protein